MSKFLDESGLNHLVLKIKTGGIVSKLANNTEAKTVSFVNESDEDLKHTTVVSNGNISIHNEGVDVVDITLNNDVVLSTPNGDHSLSEKINDATDDNIKYVRKNGSWEKQYTDYCFDLRPNSSTKSLDLFADDTVLVNLWNADDVDPGLMSAEDKHKLDSLFHITDMITMVSGGGVKIAEITYIDEEGEEQKLGLYSPSAESGPGNTSNLVLTKSSNIGGLAISLKYSENETDTPISNITIPNAFYNTNGLLSSSDYELLHSFITTDNIDKMINGTWDPVVQGEVKITEIDPGE